MNPLPPELSPEIRPIGDEVKTFVVNGDLYFGVTCRGLVFYIIRGHSIQTDIPDVEDYYTYMWANCKEGFFLLRQHFYMGVPGPWFLEAEVIPTDRTPAFFERIREYFIGHPRSLEEICGPGHQDTGTVAPCPGAGL